MAQEFIPLLGYRTGSVERPASIRHGLAFDLSGVDFDGRAIVSATLQLPMPASATATSIELSDPTEQVRYGAAACAAWSDIARVPLSSQGVQDLRGAGGAYFSIDAVLKDSTGQPWLSGGTSRSQALLLIVTEHIARAAAA